MSSFTNKFSISLSFGILWASAPEIFSTSNIFLEISSEERSSNEMNDTFLFSLDKIFAIFIRTEFDK